jgi:anti-sigma-K factor RskA
MEHQEYQELLALHALDALDASEACAITEHLGSCAACRAELDEMWDAAALLAHASTPAAPGDEVRERILKNVRAGSRDGQRVSETAGQVVPLKRQAPRSLWPSVLRLAAAIAFVALLFGVIVFWRRDLRSRQDLAQLSRQLETQQDELSRERKMLARQREALALLNSPDAKKMALAGTQTAQNARAMFVYDQKSGRGMLMTQGLPAAPAEMAYEVWFIPKGHAPMPGSMFTVDSAGHAMISDQVPMEARENAVIAITLEPKRGSAAPTGAIYLSSPAS